MLTLDELFDEYAKIYGSDAAEDEAKRTMELIDIDSNGKIEYSEFLGAMVQ